MYRFYVKEFGDNRITGPYTAKQLLKKDLPQTVLFSEETIDGGKWEELARIDLAQLAEEEPADADVAPTPRETVADSEKVVVDIESTNVEKEEEPICLNKWNWGAFVLPAIWGIGNGIYWPFFVGGAIGILASLLEFLLETPGTGQWIFYFVTIILRIYLGETGNRKAWENQKEPRDSTKFVKKQKTWNIIGGVVTVVAVLYLVISLFS